MPYILSDIRHEWAASLGELTEQIKSHGDVSAGELNYLITKILLATFPQTYLQYNNLVGVLECCKLEFYRRAIAAYEDKKIKENGDVYDNR